jgi:hypothetical protein
MGLQWTPESHYVKELAKWELRPTELVSAEMLRQQGRPVSPPFQEYPKCLYMATAATGGPAISGFIQAANDVEEATLLSRGWSTSQEGAIARVHAQDRAIAQAAAERAFAERRMSEQAKAEAAAVDESTPAHVPVIPERPIKKRRPYVRKTKETI